MRADCWPKGLRYRCKILCCILNLIFVKIDLGPLALGTRAFKRVFKSAYCELHNTSPSDFRPIPNWKIFDPKQMEHFHLKIQSLSNDRRIN